MGNAKQIQDETILTALLTTRTKSEAAKQAGCNVRTIFDRLQNYEFAAQYDALRADQLRRNLEKVEQAQLEAIDTLRKIMVSDEETTPDRLKAAQILLQYSTTAAQTVTSAERSAIQSMRDAGYMETLRHDNT